MFFNFCYFFFFSSFILFYFFDIFLNFLMEKMQVYFVIWYVSECIRRLLGLGGGMHSAESHFSSYFKKNFPPLLIACELADNLN